MLLDDGGDDNMSVEKKDLFIMNEVCKNGHVQDTTTVSPRLRQSQTPSVATATAITRVTEKQQVEKESDFATSRADINTAAALRAQYAITTPKSTKSSSRRHKKSAPIVEPADERDQQENEPLLDKTASLTLHSKKTERLQKKQVRKSQRVASQSQSRSISDLPGELLSEIIGHLEPSDVFSLLRTSHGIRDFVTEHERPLARDIIRQRYWTLYRCFPLPIAFKDVPHDAHAALLSERRQEMLNIHRKSYHQHVQMIDPHSICTCMTCVFAWNNLCLVVDLHHWQRGHLERREPIPMITRGTNPQWNQDLLHRNASIVRRAMSSPLVYACILEKHLHTTTGTIRRFALRRTKPFGEQQRERILHKPRLYGMTDADILTGTDSFLDRHGPPSYDFPFHRDNYYTVEAYLPNRKWSTDDRRWYYYALPPVQHERDLEWVKSSMKTV